jgi:hypothetical protein
MGRQPLDSILPNGFEIVEHGELPATTEQRARTAVSPNLFRQPDVRHDRKTQTDKTGRLVCEGAQPIERLTPRLFAKRFGQAASDAEASMVSIDHEGSNLGQRVAQRSQFATGHDSVAMDGDEKAADVAVQFIELSCKKMSLLEI